MEISPEKRKIIQDGQQVKETLNVLEGEISSRESLDMIIEKSREILEYAIDPISSPSESSYGLLYGLIQSGKTSVITATAAMAADNGFKCIIILTSDINLLYEQTLRRIRRQLRGLKVLGKSDWDNLSQFERDIRMSRFVVVCSKNSGHLKNLIDAFRKVGSTGANGLATLIIDDEADQASLNTKTQKNAKKRTEEISAINCYITQLRNFFQINTYLQVTATPQALFLQRPDGLYRPSFTVLTEPGKGYVGGEAFFESDSKLLKYVDLEEVDELKSGHQPSPTYKFPNGLKESLLSFLISAASRNLKYSSENFSFLCHISHAKVDHKHIIDLIDYFIEQTVNAFKNKNSAIFKKMKEDLFIAYQGIKETEPELQDFDVLFNRIEFLLPAASVKEINSNSDEEIMPDHVYSIFVGGNKLGRGVTIPNLITSYYGRNPKHPNSDTVLQHARMYGYREKHISVTRLFLPEKLADHFRIIHQMEKALRELVAKYPEGKFEGIYISSPLRATRPNVLDPDSIGVYVAGGWCNPRYPLRTKDTAPATKWLDEKLDNYNDVQDYYEIDIDFVIEIIERCDPDPNEGAELWDRKILKAALEKIKTLKGPKAYIRVRRGNDINASRRETQGFYSGGEDKLVPGDAVTIFMYKLKESYRGESVWLPQLRFPEGNYAIAFSLEK